MPETDKLVTDDSTLAPLFKTKLPAIETLAVPEPLTVSEKVTLPVFDVRVIVPGPISAPPWYVWLPDVVTLAKIVALFKSVTPPAVKAPLNVSVPDTPLVNVPVPRLIGPETVISPAPANVKL